MTSTATIRFDDAAAYERYMGCWSQLVGETFLHWLAPAVGQRWLDVGCGNGAFTEMIVQRCAPASVQGVDPSRAQLAFARERIAASTARFEVGDAMALPFANHSFDVAVMPLVIFFVPDPARGVAEMVRVLGPGGTVCAYGWDLLGGGFPYAALQDEMRALGVDVPMPPSAGAAGLDALRSLWVGAGLQAVQTTEITVSRSFANFDDYWATVLGGPSVRAGLAGLTPGDVSKLQARLRERLPTDASGQLTYTARANAVRGRVPAP